VETGFFEAVSAESLVGLSGIPKLISYSFLH